ncbi:MAG: sensor histidine kinase [Planctomycetota bacterium]
MPTRSALFFLFLFLVGVPVAAAVYLGTIGLDRERAMLVERERAAMEQRADEVRDALVRKLQALYRSELERPPSAYEALANDRRRPTQDYFQFDGARLSAGTEAAVPQDVQALLRSNWARTALETLDATSFQLQGDLAVRGVALGDTRVLQGFRIDVGLIERRFLDPASPERVVPRFDERLERVEVVPDDARLRVQGDGPFGLPTTLYRHIVPAARNGEPVLIPAGYVLALGVHPAAALAKDLEAVEGRLAWTLGLVAFVVILGMLFLWRALRAETRLAARKADFVNAVSHELRTPLTSIRMYADMLKEGWVKDEETARDYFALISAESERLARLVNNVLDFSRIEKGKKSFRMQVGDPAPVVRDVAEVLRPYLKEKGFELALEVPESLPACSFDKDALTQILVNLIDNAVKYGEKEVRLEAEAKDGDIVVRVLDRGPGVAADERQKIFDPFQRGTGVAPGGGSGLGLALVKHYATAHKGSIEVGAREGGGAAFTLRLATLEAGARKS